MSHLSGNLHFWWHTAEQTSRCVVILGLPCYIGAASSKASQSRLDLLLYACQLLALERLCPDIGQATSELKSQWAVDNFSFSNFGGQSTGPTCFVGGDLQTSLSHSGAGLAVAMKCRTRNALSKRLACAKQNVLAVLATRQEHRIWHDKHNNL